MGDKQRQKIEVEGPLGLFLHALRVVDDISSAVERFRQWAEAGHPGVVIDKELRKQEQKRSRGKES